LLVRVRLGLGMPRLAISRTAVEQIKRHSWPGNVRELLSVLQSAAVSLEEESFEIDHIEVRETLLVSEPDLSLQSPSDMPPLLSSAVERAERQAVAQGLSQCNGNRTRAAQQLGI